MKMEKFNDILQAKVKAIKESHFKHKAANIDPEAQSLYLKLIDADLSQRPWGTEDLGEDMTLVKQLIFGWWKIRFVMDHRNKTAFQFTDVYMRLAFATTDDIDWESLDGIDEVAYERAKDLEANFPTWIRSYKNGVAEVSWQINPDGRYYIDDDGFGMTDDEQIEIYGYIDRNGKVLVKFKHIHKDWNLLRRMRQKAEILAKQK